MLSRPSYSEAYSKGSFPPETSFARVLPVFLLLVCLFLIAGFTASGDGQDTVFSPENPQTEEKILDRDQLLSQDLWDRNLEEITRNKDTNKSGETTQTDKTRENQEKTEKRAVNEPGDFEKTERTETSRRPQNPSINTETVKNRDTGNSGPEGKLDVTTLNRTLPDREVSFKVEKNNSVIENVRVSVNSSIIGNTFEDGIFTARMPSKPGNYTYRFSDGNLTSSVNVEIEKLDLTTEPQIPVPLPLTPTKVKLKIGETSVKNTTVFYGSKKKKTSANGTVYFENSLENSAEFKAKAFGQETTAKISNLFLNAVITLIVLISTTTISGIFIYRKIIKNSFLASKLQRTKTLGSRENSRKRIILAKNPQISLDEAWENLKEQISIGDVKFSTPGEIKKHAIEIDGLPEKEVSEIVEKFREKMYSGENHGEKSFNFNSLTDGEES